MEIPGADISASTDRSLVWNFHMSLAAATDVSDWLLQLILVLYKHCSRRSIIHQLLSAYSKTITANKVIDSLVNR